MRELAVGGYLVTVVIYLYTWLRPVGGSQNDVLQWVSFGKLGPAEFVSLHAATLLGAIVLGRADDASGELGWLFWGMAGVYALFGLGAYLMHRSHRALIGFYVLLVIRGAQFFVISPDNVDAMRATVLKNFLMSMPFMLLVAGISTADNMLTPWQEAFLKSTTLRERIVRGRAILFTTAYYALWAYVELKWPDEISSGS
jgi:hypothetical protein